jgi:glycine/D-amino acid oxidase-like deaminating enzyme
VVIGGGLYGCLAAVAAAKRRRKVILVESGPRLLGGASALNQARVHNGYHYPRSIVTGARSHANYQRFAADFPDSLVGHSSYYAVAARGSRVTARQFEQFCNVIGIPLQPADFGGLVDRSAVAGLWRAEECVFNADALRAQLAERLIEAEVEVLLGKRAQACEVVGRRARVLLGGGEELEARLVLNCSYAGLERIASGNGRALAPRLTYELAEIAIVRPPSGYESLGLTVVDGTFFSCIPFPSSGLHSLTHVLYTPHVAADAATFPWEDGAPPPRSRFEEMRRAAEPIAPWMAELTHVRSVFATKVIPPDRDRDDARPILVHRSPPDSPVVSVLGGKLDNVYDFLAWMQTSLD